MPIVWSRNDLVVKVSHDLKTMVYCPAVAKGFRILWVSKQISTKLYTNMFTTVYTISVRSRTENWIQADSPYLKGGSNNSERVLRAATLAITELQGSPYTAA